MLERELGFFHSSPVQTTSFSISINGNLHGYFRGKQGLRQGDPMSPYLFMLVMEVLSLLLQHAAVSSNGFKYHAQCAKQKIINVSFADDLFIFVHGDVWSIGKVKQALERFTSISGLVSSPAKSTVYFCNVPLNVRQDILRLMPFQEGSLPVRYLGVPLITTKLIFKDCNPLVDRMEKKIDSWLNKSLSFAGRLQLVNSGRAKAKVALSDICLPKAEGGLGIWSISDSRGSISWGWRKLLSIRDIVRPFIWKLVRSGLQTNVWSDNWCHLSPLSSFITPRRISNVGFSISSSIADLIDVNGQWKWPQAWYDIYPMLIELNVPQLIHNMEDRTIWKDLEGNNCHFQSLEVWNVIRHRESPVPWVNGVWFSQCILRHSFHLWLVIKNKLKTQDRLAVWEVGSATNLNLMCCPLCRNNRDSRDHLFFQCSFASNVWKEVKPMVSLEKVDDSWQSIMDWMTENASSKKTEHIVCKLVISAATYFIWLERNNCLFSNAHANVATVVGRIKNTVRLCLMGFEFRGDAKVEKMLKKWEIARNEEENDPG
ncbi:uncharacterized protein LOC110881106 [Helianthus annuus]|uniref:uncharacterized protein LOC110881106 n=1 Tax=Helianthus annuus TaxID=4232 RepID=UPI000B8F50BB|nr:uncharacterized protein LOC110881106 [Helianthus annuus]